MIQAWVGHSTITMTMRYAHLCPCTGAAIRALDVATDQSKPSTETTDRASNVVELWRGGRR